ncbi:MAG: RIP metalloprotease RseP [Bacteroidetes bacterium]|nr:RIP metalloprotease RseP [Bacteroidota bacterium]
MIIESIFYFIVVIGVLVFVHELGHFLAAKGFGMRVDVFSLGMGPRAAGFKRGHTDYRISWFPLGGYVKIAGMIDESLDTEFTNNEPEPWEYRSKPRWQRMIVISAGVIMNLFIAGIIFSYLNLANGKMLFPFDSEKPLVVEENSLAWDTGLRTGDHLLKVNEQPVKYWNDLANLEQISKSNLNFTVKRDGKEIVFPAPDNFQTDLGKKSFGIGLTREPVIGTIMPGSAAEKAGLQLGDRIIAIDGTPILKFEDIPLYLNSLKTDQISISIERNNSVFDQTLTLQGKRIGISPINPEAEMIEYGFFEGIGHGFAQTITGIGAMVNSFTRIFQGKEDASQALGGPIKIFQLSGQMGSMGIDTLLNFIAMLSLSLALLNILPIPALDGGHLIILIVESLARKDLPNKIKIGIQQVGFALLITLMVFTVYNDISNMFF